MPSLAPLHPQIVHFAIALAVAGVLLRWLSLSGRVGWAGPAAAALLLTGAVALAAAARSGQDAHGPVERVPGSAQAVSEHEDWGNRAYRAFVFVGLLELLALALRSRGRAKPALVASALVGLGGLFVLYEAGEHGGELVYSYAGGVGIRTGAPEDVGRLLLAGLYHQAQLDRKAQRSEDAAALIELAARRFQADPGVQLAAAESLLLDRKDAAAAVAALERISVPPDDRRLRMRRASLLADAFEKQGNKAAALSALEQLSAEFPQNERLKKRIEQLRSGG
jgi:uncharacterized membrane protein